MNNSDISDKVKHSAAHVLAMAVSRKYPHVKVGIGPVTKNGFYYDFDIEKKLEDSDLEDIESEINLIIQEDLPFTQIILPREQAINLLLQKGQIYKAELVKAIPDSEISLFKTGDEFIDLCRGPHVSSTGKIGFIKLETIEETHWKEDPSRPLLQRIHGKVFNSFEDLSNYLKNLKKIDTYTLDLKLQNFHLGTTTGSKTLLNARGTFIYRRIKAIIEELLFVETYDELTLINYREQEDLLEKVIKRTFPDIISYKNLPSKILINNDYRYKENQKSKYIETIAEVQLLKKEDILTNIGVYIERIIKLFKLLEIDLQADIYSSKLDSNYLESISTILKNKHISHNKILDDLKDSIKIQFKAKNLLDEDIILSYLNLNFNDTPIYMDSKGVRNNSILILSLFPILNFFNFIIENKFENLPKEIIKGQIRCIPVNKTYNDYTITVEQFLAKNKKLYIEADITNKSMQKKIKRAENDNFNLVIVIGGKEKLNNSVSIRKNGKELGLLSLEKFNTDIDNYLN